METSRLLGDRSHAGGVIEAAKHVEQAVHMQRLEEDMDMRGRDSCLELSKAVVTAFGEDGQFAGTRNGREIAESINEATVFGGIGNVNNQDVRGIVA